MAHRAVCFAEPGGQPAQVVVDGPRDRVGAAPDHETPLVGKQRFVQDFGGRRLVAAGRDDRQVGDDRQPPWPGPGQDGGQDPFQLETCLADAAGFGQCPCGVRLEEVAG